LSQRLASTLLSQHCFLSRAPFQEPKEGNHTKRRQKTTRDVQTAQGRTETRKRKSQRMVAIVTVATPNSSRGEVRGKSCVRVQQKKSCYAFSYALKVGVC